MLFTASDGKTFEERAAWRMYEFELSYTFRNKKNETLMKLPGQIDGQAFDISDLDGCTVMVLDHVSQVQIDNLINCHVFVGPSSESIFVRNCTNCVFTIACKQLRTRDCSSCAIYLYSLTDPIIETSQEMTFAPFNGAYCGIERNFADARLEPENNHWSQVYDFNDLDKTGCNWRILSEIRGCLVSAFIEMFHRNFDTFFIEQEEEVAPWVVDIEPHVPGAAMSLGACVNPVARDSSFVQYTDTSSSSFGGMHSFAFSISQKEATAVVQPRNEMPSTPPCNTFSSPSVAQPQPLPVAPTILATIPTPCVAAEVSIMPPPAPIQAPTDPKQTTLALPEHVHLSPEMPPALPKGENDNITTKGPPEASANVALYQVTEMLGIE